MSGVDKLKASSSIQIPAGYQEYPEAALGQGFQTRSKTPYQSSSPQLLSMDSKHHGMKERVLASHESLPHTACMKSETAPLSASREAAKLEKRCSLERAAPRGGGDDLELVIGVRRHGRMSFKDSILPAPDQW